jgi:cell division protein FtsN
MTPDKSKIEFAFDRRGLTLLIGGSALTGLSLFAIGILVGVELNLPRPAAEPSFLASVKAAGTEPPKSRVTAPVAAPVPQKETTPPVTPVTPPPSPLAATLAPPKPADQPAAAPKPAANSPFLVVEVGSFRDKTNAESLAEDLGGKGYSASVVDRKDHSGRSWMVVRVGPYEQWKDASQAASDLTHFRGSAPIVRAVKN